jgi:hypothetical protein
MIVFKFQEKQQLLILKRKHMKESCVYFSGFVQVTAVPHGVYLERQALS